ncbi:MAG: UDP-N-acetylmuramate dehydrogenase [Bacteroidales bacterium]|nr:UDP-N-acetylmuramate dehydrogenase [Bacteroidales bacterium]
MRIQLNYDLSAQNTFRMKVSCACWVEYETVKELEGLNFERLPKPLLHIGEGSNLLFTQDFPGTVLHSNIEYIKYVDMGFEDVPVMVGAGVVWDYFVSETCRHGLWGAENLSLIPGEVGAAAVQNIGAYGVEIKDILSGVVAFDLQERKRVKFSREECRYGYRDSFFKQPENKGRYVITSVLLRLSRKPNPRLDYKGVREALGIPGQAGNDGNTVMADPKSVMAYPEPVMADLIGHLTPQQVREAVIRIRRQKLPDPEELGSAGSFFKNPVVSRAEFARISPDGSAPHYDLPDGMVKVPAAWMIDQCGLKGATEGGAAVYDKQPLVLVNASGSATPQDVLALEQRIINGVQERFGVTLHPEVDHI